MPTLINRTVLLLTRLWVHATQGNAPQALTRLFRETVLAKKGEVLSIEISAEGLTVLRDGVRGFAMQWNYVGLSGRWADGTVISADEIGVFFGTLHSTGWIHTVRDAFARTYTPCTTFDFAILPAIGKLSRALIYAHKGKLPMLATMIGAPLWGVEIVVDEAGQVIARMGDQALLQVDPEDDHLTLTYRTDMGLIPVSESMLKR